MKNRIIKFLIILFSGIILSTTVSSYRGDELVNLIHLQDLDEKILYVGGSGPQNYSKIQDAIDNASTGDTIFVYSKLSPYYENIIIRNNFLKIIGEEKHNTIIDGSGIGHVINIDGNNVILERFTIQHSGPTEEFEYDSGIHVTYMSNHIIISDNIISNNQHGIFLDGCSNITIFYNIISNNIEGLIIYGNAQNNNITGNKIENNRVGIHEAFTRYINIISNDIANNTEVGIICSCTVYHITKKNNFINNLCHAYFDGKVKYFFERNHWIQNYWDNWIGIGPMIIKGRIYVPWINFDWFPVHHPYDISINNQEIIF